MRALSIAFLLVLVGSVPAWSAPNETKVSELAPGVYFRKAQTEPKFTGCNQGWIVFRDYVLVIDANFPGQVEEVVRTIRQTTDKPIRFVFDTHYHGDHADGNMQYAKIGATVVAHERSQPLFQTKGLDGFQKAQQGADRKDEYGPLSYVMPSLYFSHKLIFDDGEQRVELLFLGHAHTAGDAVAWLPKHGILFTGDACVNGAFNYTGDSDTESWIGVLAAMQEMPVRQIAPGHGELAGKELLGLQRRYFVELRQAVQKALAAGQSLDQIKEQIELPFYQEWTGVAASTRVENIEHVHRELTAAPKPLPQEKAFRDWSRLPGAGQYARLHPGEPPGSTAADRRWSHLAEWYLRAGSGTRKQIRDYFAGRTEELAEMQIYLQRMTTAVQTPQQVDLLRRGLAIAAIEGGRSDYPRLVAALTDLRTQGDRAGIATDSLFREIQQPEFLAPENRAPFELARTQPVKPQP